MRYGKMVLVGFALTISVLAGACAPEGPSPGPSAAPVSPVPQASPTATSTASPADIEATLTRAAQFDQQLRQLSADNPSQEDLVNSVQNMLTVMDYVTTYYPQMTAQQRTQALGAMTGMLGDEVSVVNTHARVFRATATAFAVAHPPATAAPGTQTPPAVSPRATLVPTATSPTPPAAGAGTPTVSPAAQQLIGDLNSIRSETVNLAAGQPTDQEIVSILGRLQADLSQLSQQSSSMSDSDVLSVLNDMDRAVAYLVPVVQTLTNQESSSIATPTPPPTPTSAATPTPPSTPTRQPTSTPGP